MSKLQQPQVGASHRRRLHRTAAYSGGQHGRPPAGLRPRRASAGRSLLALSLRHAHRRPQSPRARPGSHASLLRKCWRRSPANGQIDVDRISVCFLRSRLLRYRRSNQGVSDAGPSRGLLSGHHESSRSRPIHLRHEYRVTRPSGSRRPRREPARARPGRPVTRNLVTCAMLGIEPTPRERAVGLIGEWPEVLTGCPEPTQH